MLTSNVLPRSASTLSFLSAFYSRAQKGILNIGLSDLQLIYCTIKIARIKRGALLDKNSVL